MSIRHSHTNVAPAVLPFALFLFVVLKPLYGPATVRGKREIHGLPYAAYLGYFSKFPFRQIEHTMRDHLCPPLAFYLSRATLAAWFAKIPGAVPDYRWHNRNSWNVIAEKPA